MQASFFAFGNARIERASGRAWIGSVEIEYLPRRQRQVAELLAQHAPNTVTHERLLDWMYQSAEEPGIPENVRQQVFVLRRWIARNGVLAEIRTLRSTGYALVAPAPRRGVETGEQRRL